ncbi:MAG: protein kinase [Thermosynechococcaceae cyanobacterium]
MTICINPDCNENNSEQDKACTKCGSSLVLNNVFRAIKILTRDDRRSTDIYELVNIEDNTHKILKVLARYTRKEVDMFRREAQTLEILSGYSKIPKVDLDSYFEYNPSNFQHTLYCLAQDKVEGQTLEEWVRSRKKVTSSQIINILNQLAQIIEYIHRKNIIHRDIKPSNIIMGSNDELTLIDFGSSRNYLTTTYLLKVNTIETSGAMPGTEGMTVWISPGYTAPEQINGKANQQSDFFSLGRTLVYTITGRHPLELMKNTSYKQLKWREYAAHIERPVLDLIDELMNESSLKRPKNAHELTERISKIPAKIKRLRIFTSWYTRMLMSALLVAVIFGLYKFYCNKKSQDYLSEGNKNLFEIVDYNKARHYFELSIQYKPDNISALNNLALTCATLKEDECAINNYKKVISIKPVWNAFFNLGGYYEDKGSYSLAKQYYQKSIEISNSQVADPFNNLARIEILQKNYVKATNIIRQGLQKSTERKTKAALLKNLGWVEFKQNKNSLAEQNLLESNRLDPERADTFCLLAQTAEALGKPATQWWEPCLRLNTPDSSSQEVQEWRSQILNRALSKGN